MRSLPAIRRMSSIPMSASTAALARMAALPALSRQNKSCTKGKRRAKRRLFLLSSRKSRHAIFAGEETPSSHASASHLRGSPIYSFSLAALDSFSRGGARARSGNAPNNGAFPSSKAVKAPPGLCQESAFSPLRRAPKMREFHMIASSSGRWHAGRRLRRRHDGGSFVGSSGSLVLKAKCRK